MSNVDVIVDAKPRPNLPIDPSVKIPDSVKRAAAAADAYYQQTPPAEPAAAPATPPAEPVQEPVQPAPEPVAQPVAPEPPKPKKPRAAAPTAPAEPVAQPATPPADTDWQARFEQAEHQYRSMKGRYEANQGVMAQMQEQMSLMANELTRTQAMLNQPANQPQQRQSLVTDEDRKNYGDDLIDLTQRAAREAVEPEIDAVKQENQRLQQRLIQQQQQGVMQALDGAVPNWREINRSQRFRQWLSLPDIYSGMVRKQMLDAAFAAASAPRVVAFFKGFIADEVATGNIDPPVTGEQPTPAPRTPVLAAEQIAAPGRARPASGGNTPAPADDKPTFTRAQIAKFYSDVRAGVYRGRDADKNSTEQAIFLAQREGRVR